MSEFYTFNEVCEKFKIARSTLNRYMNDGKISYFKTGTSRTCKVLFYKKQIENFIKSLNRPEKNITELAKELGVSRVTIYTFKEKYGRLPNKNDFKRG
jgi:predicted site-specific integrase-resolvase